MKKTLFPGLIALAALTMTSCSNDENMLSIPQDNAIEFGTYIGRDAQTKGVVLNNGNLLNFGVFASYTNETDWSNIMPNFMFNQNVSRTEITSPWTYSPKKYWPTHQGDKISFWAYAPYAKPDNGITVTSNSTSATVPQITYEITEDNLTTQADFVTDVQMNEVRTGSGDPDGDPRTVSFGFRHELTRVGIWAKLDRDAVSDGTKVNITKVLFGGTDFINSATYDFASTTDARGTWTTKTSNADLTINNILDAKAAVDLGDYNESGVFLENETPVNLFKEDQYLFLIPFAAGITDQTVKLTVYYDIVTKDEALNGDYSKTSAIKVIELPKNAQLLMQGKAYNFNLTFNLNEIQFTASVAEEWGDAIGNDQNVDWNDTDL